MKVYSTFKNYYHRHPLLSILALGLLVRLLAVFFSGGYMASDDHFVVVKVANSWLEGGDMWLGNEAPVHRSIFYPGVVYVIMLAAKSLGITAPENVMLFNRFLHALFSLSIIFLSYKMVEKMVGNENLARRVALFTACLFIMPYLSVRNLIEMVCIPFLMGSIFLAYLSDKERGNLYAFLGGIAIGVSFMIRFQTGICGIPLFLYLLIVRKNFKASLFYSSGAILILLLFGFTDWLIWGEFFGSVISYINYNLSHAQGYITGPWYKFILLIWGIFIPPLSIFLFVGGIYSLKEKDLWVVTIPTWLFFIIHSYFPNKQERFIIPILPLLIVIGFIGLTKFREEILQYSWKRFFKVAFIIFWIINIPLLFITSLNYSQKARIEPLIYLRKHNSPSQIEGLYVDITEREVIIPWYYLGYNRPKERVKKFKKLGEQLDKGKKAYNFAIIFSDGSLENHLQQWRKYFDQARVVKHFNPSMIDYFLHRINPKYNHSKESWLIELERDQ